MEALLPAWQVLQAGGLPLGLAVVIWTGLRRLWVFGWLYEDSITRVREMQQERDEWRRLALSGTALASQATTTAGGPR